MGRSRWRNLRVRDRRDVGSANGIATELVEHVTAATNGGVLRNTITIFAPDHPVAGPHARIWTDQLIRYAGHTLPDGRIVGDPAQAEFTRLAAGRVHPRPRPAPRRHLTPPPPAPQEPGSGSVSEAPKRLEPGLLFDVRPSWLGGVAPAGLGAVSRRAHPGPWLSPAPSANHAPRVMVGVAPPDYLKEMVAEPFDAFTFSPVALSVYQLGNFGTARKKLKVWELKP